MITTDFNELTPILLPYKTVIRFTFKHNFGFFRKIPIISIQHMILIQPIERIESQSKCHIL